MSTITFPDQVDLVLPVPLAAQAGHRVRDGASRKSLTRSVTTRLTSSGMDQSRLRSVAARADLEPVVGGRIPRSAKMTPLMPAS
jgi:hypothetical protein